MARKIGVDEETIRRRLARMRQARVIQGWRLLPNPRLIGQEIFRLDLDLIDATRKAAPISQIKLLDGVILIIDYLGTGLSVVLYCDSEQALMRKVQLVASICGCEGPTYWKVGFPACEQKLRRVDWQIVKAIMMEPRKNLSDIAHETKLSTRTISRRMELMTKANAFFLMPVVDLKKIPFLACSFRVFCPRGRNKHAIDDLILSKMGAVAFAHTEAEEYSSFSQACVNLAEAEEIHDRIKAMEGVKEVRMDIEKEIIPVHEWVEEQIERGLRESAGK